MSVFYFILLKLSLGVDEAASITLLYPNQRFATINVSTNCAMFGPTFIAGDKGVIQVYKNKIQPYQLNLCS